MHYELYIDSVFFLNFMMNLYLLLLVDRSTLRIATAGRLIMGAATGALCALLPFLTGGPGIPKLVAGAAAAAAGMLYITFSVRGLRMFLKLLERLVIYSFGMGGAMLFLIRLIPGVRGLMCSVPGIAGMGGLFFLLLKRFQKELYDGDSLCRAILYRPGKKVRAEALIDSGNSLFEPISGKPVCVVAREVFDELWESGQEGFRVIPYHSIGKSHGILRGYLLPGLILEAGGMEYRFTDVYVAVSEEKISASDSADAGSVNMIINPRLFAEDKKGSRRRRQNERRYDTEGYDTGKDAVQDDSQG
ncbi:MAG: sigma-E processing peptidase SpoIIGA [Lachnospiraceae bacterium]|nr:sigma-E processing peptidase SpoIIGA [Lachnospiraceae bacterium]